MSQISADGDSIHYGPTGSESIMNKPESVCYVVERPLMGIHLNGDVKVCTKARGGRGL